MSNLKRWSVVLFVLAFVGCTIPVETAQQPSTSTALPRLEQEVHRLVNRYRMSQNLAPLATNEIITEQARRHSRAMAKKRTSLGHHGFAKRVERISRSLPYRAVAENVGYSKGYSDSAQMAVDVWLRSRGHRRNIEGNFQLTGIGVAMDSQGAYYFTQIFWQ